MINIKNIPENPGVYLMKNSDEILYIGKAKNLNKRVSQYFDEKLVEKRGIKIKAMVELIDNIDYIVTNTEQEALILENNLIKLHKPRYNTLLKDDKTYPYIKIDLSNEYPYFEITRSIDNDNCKYFGPYTTHNVSETLNKLVSFYNVRHCDNKLPKKECIYKQMNVCMAPCVNNCKKEYENNIKKIINILSGKDNLSDIKEKMQNCSKELLFEEAAKYRDLINDINKITNKQIVANISDSQDIISYYENDEKVCIVIFNVRNNKIIAKKDFIYDKIETLNIILNDFIKLYYINNINIPNEIISLIEINDSDIILEALSKYNKKVKFITPKRGKKLDLINLATKNAQLLLNEYIRKKENHNYKDALNEICDIVKLKNIGRIEAFDISNTSGVLNVASMIVFNNGFQWKQFRKFKLDISGNNDYLCLTETLKRRFSDEKLKDYPDLLLIDGGKGQVNCAIDVLDELNIDIPVCGMVIDDNHRTRGLYFNNKEYALKKSFNLITQIQDQTHNFAIGYHQKLRSKTMIKSILDNIPSIGPKKKKDLMTHFKDINKIKTATKEELMNVNGISSYNADKIIEYFKNKE